MKHRTHLPYRILVLVLTLALMLGVAATGAAAAGTYSVAIPDQGQRYVIKPACSSGFAMDVSGGGDAPEHTAIHLWETNGSDAQVWRLRCVDAGEGWFVIIHERTGLVLNVVNGDGRNDARLQLYHDDGTAACHFRFADTGDGYVIQSRVAGGAYVIDLDNALAFSGSIIHLWSAHDGLSARWKLEPVGGTANGAAKTYPVVMPDQGQLYVIKPACSSGFAMDVSGGGAAPEGTSIHLWEVNGTDAQIWRLRCVDAGEGWFVIIHERTGLVLNVVNGDGRNDARLQLYHDDGTAACHFRFVDTGDGYVIQSRVAGGAYVIDLDNALAFNDSIIHLWSAHDGLSARWKLEPVRVSTTMYVRTNGSRLLVRSAPSFYGTILDRLPNGSAVEVLSISGSWAEIRYGSGVAYVSANYLSAEAPNAGVSALQQAMADTARSYLGNRNYNGYCQKFVRVVAESCGIYTKNGASSALDACKKWRVSTSMDDIPVGAAVYLQRKTPGTNGYTYGHVGIYVGVGKIVHAQDTVKCTALSDMLPYYNYLGWGWQGGVDLR